MRIYQSITDELATYARSHLFDKKTLDHILELYGYRDGYKEALEQSQQDLEKMKKNLEELEKDSDEYLEKEEKVKRYSKAIKEAQKNLKTNQDRIDEAIRQTPKARYDRYKLDDNIRNYLEMTNVPLGELEKESGMSIGALSRWERSIMTNELPLSFLLTASEKFGTTVMDLLYGDARVHSGKERDIVRFIENLQKLTNSEEIRWQEVEPADRRHGRRLTPQTMKSRLYQDVEGVFFKSDFGFDYNYQRDKAAFSAKFPTSNDIVYLYSLETMGDNEQRCMEMYIQSQGSDNDEPIYSTLENVEVLNYMMESLYNAAKNSAKRVVFSDEVRFSMARLNSYASKSDSKKNGKGGNE